VVGVNPYAGKRCLGQNEGGDGVHGAIRDRRELAEFVKRAVLAICSRMRVGHVHEQLVEPCD
jgi:hypothetical protein